VSATNRGGERENGQERNGNSRGQRDAVLPSFLREAASKIPSLFCETHFGASPATGTRACAARAFLSLSRASLPPRRRGESVYGLSHLGR